MDDMMEQNRLQTIKLYNDHDAQKSEERRRQAEILKLQV